MIQSPTDSELTVWIKWACESNEVPSFVRAVAEAASLSDAPTYALLRPVLLELKQRRPMPSTSEIYQSENQELPFNSYPHGGREPLKRRPGYNTRQADAPEFMRLTGA